MKRKCIVIATPTFGSVSMHWAIAYRGLRKPVNSVSHEFVKIGLEIGLARNLMVVEALRDIPDASHIFFLDDDVVPNPFCILELLSVKKPVVGGVYYIKSPFGGPLIFDDYYQQTIDYIPGIGLKKVHAAGGGLLLVEIDVFRKMQETLDLGTDSLGSPQWFKTTGDLPDEPVTNEDCYFFNRLSEAGIECWVDMGSYTFAWHFDTNGQYAYPKKQWDEYLKEGTATWEVSDNNSKKLENLPRNVKLITSLE